MHRSIHARPNYVASHEYDVHVVRQAHDWMLRFAKFPVKHETLEVGDYVKIRIKTPSFYKETFNSWSPKVYKIESVDQTTPEGTTYRLEGYRRPLLRYELKKIEDVHRLAGGQLTSVLHAVTHRAALPPQAPEPAVEPEPAAAPARRRAPFVPGPRPLTRSVARANAAAAAVPPPPLPQPPLPPPAELAPAQLPARRRAPAPVGPRPNTRSVTRAAAAAAAQR